MSGAPPVQLSTFTVSDLAALAAGNRTAVMLELVTHFHSVILEVVGQGRRSAIMDHPLMFSEWLNDSTFQTELEETLQGLFPGTDLEVIEEVSRKRLSFSYTV